MAWDKERVDRYHEGLSFSVPGPGSAEFSAYPCDSCGSNDDDNRHEIAWWEDESGVMGTDIVCTNCAHYLANGTLPDEA